MTDRIDMLMELAWNQLWQVSVVTIIVATLVRAFGRQ